MSHLHLFEAESKSADLRQWHILKWHNAIRQLTRSYTDAVYVRLGVVATQILQMETLACATVCYCLGDSSSSSSGRQFV